MKKNHYSRKRRQLSRLIEQLKLHTDNPKQSLGLIHRIKLRIKFLLQELSGSVSKYQLKRILGSFAIVFGFTVTASSQVFTAPVQNPFGLSPSAVIELSFPEFADLDNDGDLDILAGSYYSTFQYFENTGSASAPAFAAPISDPFGLVGSQYLDMPAIADLDGDGDLDLLVGQYYGDIVYFENTGSASNPAFAAPVSLPFGLSATYNLAFPDFADLDNDGDMDLLVGESGGNFQYFENTGTATVPSFAAPIQNPNGLAANGGYIAAPEFADLDNDGDLDLIVGAYYGNLEYYMNTGTVSSPTFSAVSVNPFGLTATYEWAFPLAADLDDDGDIDLLVAEYYGVFQYFEQIDPSTSLDEIVVQGSIDPNPFMDQVNFNFDQSVVRAEFVNLSGQVVLTIQNPNSNVDVSSLHQGLYIVNCIHSNDQKSTYRLQKL